MRAAIRTLAVLGTAAGLWAGACKNDNTSPDQVSNVLLSPDRDTLAVGDSLQLPAIPVNAAGAGLSGFTVTWASSNPGVASVSGSGLVSAVAQGTTEIRATVSSITDSAEVTVIAAVPVPIAEVLVKTARDTLAVGDSIPAIATALDAAGDTLSTVSFTWVSSDTTIATVSSAGEVDARGPGTVQISATSEGTTGSETILVISASLSPALLRRRP